MSSAGVKAVLEFLSAFPIQQPISSPSESREVQPRYSDPNLGWDYASSSKSPEIRSPSPERIHGKWDDRNDSACSLESMDGGNSVVVLASILERTERALCESQDQVITLRNLVQQLENDKQGFKALAEQGQVTVCSCSKYCVVWLSLVYSDIGMRQWSSERGSSMRSKMLRGCVPSSRLRTPAVHRNTSLQWCPPLTTTQ